MVVQSRRLDHLRTRLVITLKVIVGAGQDEPRLVPAFLVEGRRVVLVPWQVQTMALLLLGPVIASLASDESADKIAHAIDLVTRRAFG